MTKTPRNLHGKKLGERLKRLGYFDDFHHGDHFIYTTLEKGEHHVSIPQHKPMKVGTLSAILKDIARHHGLTVQELLSRLGL